MALKVRRIITGHDASGKAIAKIDEVVSNVREGRPGAHAHAIWTTEGFPASNDTQEDAGARPVQTTLPGGTIFRVIEFKPGVQARNHRSWRLTRDWRISYYAHAHNTPWWPKAPGG